MSSRQENRAPTPERFRAFTSEAFAFVQRYGLVEIPADPHESSDPFTVRFAGNNLILTVRGIMWGFAAEANLRRSTANAPELPIFLLVPENQRQRPATVPESSQLSDVATIASQLQTWGDRALRGELDELENRYRDFMAALRESDSHARERMRLDSIVRKARDAARRKDFRGVVRLLSKEPALPPLGVKLLELARRHQE